MVIGIADRNSRRVIDCATKETEETRAMADATLMTGRRSSCATGSGRRADDFCVRRDKSGLRRGTSWRISVRDKPRYSDAA